MTKKNCKEKIEWEKVDGENPHSKGEIFSRSCHFLKFNKENTKTRAELKIKLIKEIVINIIIYYHCE